MKIFYQLEDDTNRTNNTWFVPNREETYSGMVKMQNFMDYFLEATGGKTPILIKNIFEDSDFGDEKVFAVTVNGKKKVV